MPFETISTHNMSQGRVELSDWDIENARATSLEKAHYDFQRAESEVLTPPVFPGAERNHDDVAEVYEELTAEQPSTAEQMNALTNEQIYHYLGAYTDHQMRARQEMRTRQDYALAA